MSKTKLKIGILINSYNIPYWQYKIVEEIQNSVYGEVTLVIKNNAFETKLIPELHDIHLHLDKFFLGRSTDYSKKSDLKVLIKDTPEIAVIPINNGFQDQLETIDLKKIKSFDPDVILKFGFKELAAQILTIPKNGVWFYGPCDRDVNRADLLGYWEVINKLKTTASTLEILKEAPEANRIIHRSWMLTNDVSISKNRNLCYSRAAAVIPRIIEGLYNFGEPYLFKCEKENRNEVNFYSRSFYKTPSLLTALKNIFVHFAIISKRLFRKIFYVDFWQILYTINSNERFFSSLREFELLPTPRDRFWADPFVISTEDRHFIFVEELIYKTNKGHIAVIEIDNKGNIIHSKKVLEKKYHLSYPFLLKYDCTYYMIPETGENKTIELYKCIDFPYKWEFVMNLMEGIRTADVTLFYHHNKWWLFCCTDKTGLHEGLLDELHLFYSDNLFSKNWQSHPDNPIITDARTARPAGEIFIKDNKIYRPSQDCSGIYGRCININEIIKLSETEYKEIAISKINTDFEKDLIGTHTFNSTDKIVVADGFKYKRRLDIKV